MPTDEEMFRVALNRIEKQAEEFEDMAERYSKRENGAGEMLYEAAMQLRRVKLTYMKK